MLSIQAQTAIRKMEETREDSRAYALTEPLDIQRRDWESAACAYVQPEHTVFREVEISGITAGLIEKKDSGRPGSGILLHFHGGGLTQGSAITHRALGTSLTQISGRPVLIHNYPLAPEHPFPAALNASVNVYCQLLQNGHAPEDIVFGGDSSGATLGCAVLLQLRHLELPLPGALYLLSPQLDNTFSGETIQLNRDQDHRVFLEDLQNCSAWYRGPESADNPLVSPFFGDVTGFPRTFIQTGGSEILLSDSLGFAEKIKAAGVPVTLDIRDRMWHVFQADADEIPEAAEALAKLADFLNMP